MEAFAGQGKGDYQSSHDVEDPIAVIDGRSELLTEIHTAPKDVRTYIASGIAKLLVAPAFLDALPGYLFAAARWRRGGAHSEECSSSVLITPHSPC